VATVCADRGVAYAQTSLLGFYAQALGHLAAAGGEKAGLARARAVPVPGQRGAMARNFSRVPARRQRVRYPRP
jgi:hypothetical protein